MPSSSPGYGVKSKKLDRGRAPGRRGVARGSSVPGLDGTR